MLVSGAEKSGFNELPCLVLTLICSIMNKAADDNDSVTQGGGPF